MSLINWATCKKLILELAATRPQKYTRVSSDVKDHLEYVVRHACHTVVQSQPSKGKTVQMGTHKRKVVE